jgi:carbamoyltransferase
MKILGIHDGHNCGATLLEDGVIVASISEERLSRVKNDAGYPKRAVEEILKITKNSPRDIDKVALATIFLHSKEFYLSWDWYKKGEKEQIEEKKNKKEREEYFLNQRMKERKDQIYEHLGIPIDKIIIVEHHLAHAAAAYYGSPWVNTKEKILVFTLDGSGDGICSTVNIAENQKITRIAETKSDASLAKIYSRITYLLGMKPWEHEYKVMGLAPYADENGVNKSYEVLNKLIELDKNGLTFKTKTSLATNYCYPYLKENLENHRFDWIAGAIQKLQEKLVVSWVENTLNKIGINKIACGGGSFMNVKTNMLLTNIEKIKDVFIFPSCGDESLSIGAAYHVYAEWLENNKENDRISPLGNNYSGPEFSFEEIKKDINAAEVNRKYRISKEDDINRVIADLLASGEIVARFAGRMEWGARALGNRSILMDPRNKDKVRELNACIKMRDFWMPFAPTIIAERQRDYLINPKNIKSPYMIMAFQTTEKGKKDLIAAIHPYDFTVRPQILEVNFNPDYYSLIKEFEKITGVGAVLNTSFNLHGEPIVCTSKDALDVFERSGLKYLAMGNYLIIKKSYGN